MHRGDTCPRLESFPVLGPDILPHSAALIGHHMPPLWQRLALQPHSLNSTVARQVLTIGVQVASSHPTLDRGGPCSSAI